ncbi:MAG: deoxyribonuclease IV [Methanomicrobiales archaeon]|nr:deoxyribonuclease IV [Methanomicrobiales archaeon]
MVRVGVHVSIAGSISLSVERAKAAGCDTFQIFSRNPRGWSFKPIPEEEAERFREALRDSKTYPPVDHMPYLPNLASPRDEIYEKSVMTLAAELERCALLGIPYLVTHLGHHMGAGLEAGQRRVCGAIDTALERAKNDVILLLENTAGEKNSVGSSIGEIQAVFDGIGGQERIGICFDTCHAFAAGMDIASEGGIGQVLGEFDEKFGLERLKVIHLNDSVGECGSGLDRHEHIGMGRIGEEGFRRILADRHLRTLPLICETPVDSRRDDKGNIAKVRELAG